MQGIATLIQGDKQASTRYLYFVYGQKATNMNESGVAVMKLCVRMHRITYRKEVRNMETRLGDTCIKCKVLILRYTSIHVCCIGGRTYTACWQVVSTPSER